MYYLYDCSNRLYKLQLWDLFSVKLFSVATCIAIMWSRPERELFMTTIQVCLSIPPTTLAGTILLHKCSTIINILLYSFIFYDLMSFFGVTPNNLLHQHAMFRHPVLPSMWCPYPAAKKCCLKVLKILQNLNSSQNCLLFWQTTSTFHVQKPFCASVHGFTAVDFLMQD